MATGYSMGTASGTDIPIEHFDYEYVSKCNNSTEVEKILKVLRSKTEGHYPELITHTEAKLRELNPNSKLLITSQKAKRVADLPNKEWREVTSDIEQWEHLMREERSSATGGSDSIVDDLPPIRSGGTISGPPPQSSTDSKKRSNKPAQEPIKSFDFHTWDKYDAETAAKQAEEEDDNDEDEVSSKEAPVHLPAVVSKRELSVSSAERERLSIREKDKGNEAFKSCDYHEAMVYYSRSIQFKPSAAAYNNRALIAIKLEKFLEAVKDCNEVLKLERNNTKALLRRATAYHALKDYKEATSDLDRVLQLEPTNKRAQELLTKVKSSHLPEEKKASSTKKKGRRIQIEEVEGEVEPSSAATTTATTTTASVSKPPVAPPLPPPLPAQVQKLKDEGNQLFKTGQYGTAVTCYTKAIEQLRKSSTKHTLSIATLLSNRAACHLKIGDCHQCITDCTQSIVLSPVNVKALMRRATAYDTLEKFRQAYNDYHLALRLDSSQAIAHSACTRIQQYLRDQDGSNWRSKLPVNPEAESVMAAYYAQAAAQQLPCGGAVPPVVTSTASSPTSSATAVTNTTSTITNVTETSEAAGGGGASETDNKIGKFEMLKVQGNALVKKGDCSGAIQCYTECIQLLPDEVVPYTNRALCYLKVSKYSEADVDCTKCLELQPSNVKALYRRALARKELGKYGESMRDIKKLLEIDPENSAGLKEEGVVKELWTKKLRTIQQKQDTTPSTQTSTTPSKSTSKRKKSSSKSPPTKDTRKEEKPTSEVTKPADEGAATQTKKGKGKRRKRVAVEEVTETAPEVKPEPVIREEVVVNGDRETSEAGALGEGEEREAASSRVKLADIKPEKASVFDYIQMWNSTPSSASPLDHAQLLLRIPPTSLPKVVTNKLDGNKLSSIIAALHHHIMPEELYTSVYDILLSLSRVDRFSTITMFLSTNDKQSLEAIFSSLSTHLPSELSLAAVQQLRATYL